MVGCVYHITALALVRNFPIVGPLRRGADPDASSCLYFTIRILASTRYNRRFSLFMAV